MDSKDWIIAAAILYAVAITTTLIFIRNATRKRWPYIPPEHRCTYTNKEVRESDHM